VIAPTNALFPEHAANTIYDLVEGAPEVGAFAVPDDGLRAIYAHDDFHPARVLLLGIHDLGGRGSLLVLRQGFYLTLRAVEDLLRDFAVPLGDLHPHTSPPYESSVTYTSNLPTAGVGDHPSEERFHGFR